MSPRYGKEPFGPAQIVELILKEKAKALSPREWKHRLVGYGYSIKDSAEGQIVTSWPSGKEICMLPEESPEAI